MDRRSFIKLTAITGTSATLASCGNPENQFIRFVPAEDIVPGVAVWKPSVCPLCSAGCGLTVRVMDADQDVVRGGQAGIVRISAAKKLEGAPGHPVSQGRLCARGQAAIQVTYHPDRITQPLKRSGNRGEGKYQAISWDDAIAEITSKLDALEGGGNPGGLSYIARRLPSHRAALIRQFLARFGATDPVTYELFGEDILRRANATAFGREQLPTFDLANSRFVLSFGADFLGTWNSPVAQGAAYGAMRQGRPGVRGAFAQIESRMSQTGANADEWVPIRPGTEGALALGIAHAIMAAKLRPSANGGRAGAAIEGWNDGLARYTPQDVERMTGVTAARVERLARQFAEGGASVAIIGGPALAHSNGLFNALAVNALNALTGSVEQPGGVYFTPQLTVAAKTAAPAARPAATIDRLAAGILDGSSKTEVLLVDGANPVFTTPKAWKVREAFNKVPYIASFSSFLDETSILSDLILPDHSFLEGWSEAIPESGSLSPVASVAPAAMRPLYDTRATGDVLLEIGRKLRKPLPLPWMTFDEMVGATFMALPAPSADTDAWTDAQAKGFWTGTLPTGLTSPAGAAASAARAVAYADPQFDGDAQQFPLHLMPYASSAFLDGSLAHLPWLQEMPDPMTSAMWSSWVEINPATAEKLAIAQGDVVEVSSSQGSVRSTAMITPGIAPDVIAMPVGQGHQTFTRFASKRGENPIELIAPVTEATTGALAWAATRVKIAKVGPADGRLVMFAGGMREEGVEGR